MSAAGERYMKLVRRLSCAICVRLGHMEECSHTSPVSESHHPRTGAGGARKSADEDTVPLCVPHHRGSDDALHAMGRKAWERKFGVTELELIPETRRRVQEMLAMEV